MMNVFNGIIDYIPGFLTRQTIYTAILFAVVFVLTIILRKKSPVWHYGLWTLVLIRLVLPVDFGFSFSARNVLERISLSDRITETTDMSFNELKPIPVSSIRTDETVEGDIPVSENLNTISNVSNTPVKEQIPLNVILVFIWLTGCITMLLFVSIKLLKFFKILKNSTVVNDNKLLSCMNEWRQRLKIRRRVTIVSSDDYLIPFSTGIIRPRIYIPCVILNSEDEDTANSIIAHELVHIKRFDALFIRLQNILQVIYFFNPLVWIVCRQIASAREQICDSAVLKNKIISPQRYGKSIIRVLNYNLFGMSLTELIAGFGSSKKIFAKRIRNIKKEEIMSKWKVMLIVVAVILLGVFVLPLGKTITKAGQDTTDNNINFLQPINNAAISSFFGWRKSPFDIGEQFHFGNDIAAPAGTPIYASAPGIVKSAGWGLDGEGAYGYTILIEHENGFSTVYAHCKTNSLMVKPGQEVKAGDKIAECRKTGLTTGTHLHFELRKDGKLIDPYFIVNKLPVLQMAYEIKIDKPTPEDFEYIED